MSKKDKKIIIYTILLIALGYFAPGLAAVILIIVVLSKLSSNRQKRLKKEKKEFHTALANNPELAKAAKEGGVDVDYVKALGVDGLAGAYLDATSGHANEVLKKNWPKIQEIRKKQKEKLLN